MQGQVYVSCANVVAVAPAIMRHRMAVNFTAQSEGISTDDIVRMILEKIPQDEPLNN